jgi:hypothetical protein
VSEGRQGENAALLLAGEKLALLTTNAELILAEANEKSFNIIRRYRVAESPTWAHHVFVGNGVLIKDKSTLSLWTFE